MNRTTHPPGGRPLLDRSGAATAAPLPARTSSRRQPRPRSQQWAAWAFLAPVTLYLVLFYAYPL
ncbi:ABC transporter permease, partial [Streptomyces azureus]